MTREITRVEAFKVQTRPGNISNIDDVVLFLCSLIKTKPLLSSSPQASGSCCGSKLQYKNRNEVVFCDLTPINSFAMLTRALSRSKIPNFSSIIVILQNLTTKQSIIDQTQLPLSKASNIQSFLVPAGLRQYHDGRPRGPLWRGKKLIGKEALFVILGLKRFKNDDDEKLDRFIKTHVFRLLKLDMIAVLSELERQEEVSLAVKVVLLFSFSVNMCCL